MSYLQYAFGDFGISQVAQVLGLANDTAKVCRIVYARLIVS